MLLAHAPAGYLLGRILSRTVFKDRIPPERSDSFYRNLILAGMIGGILPDIDFIYHIFIDSDKTPHHSYITHMPVFWLALMSVFLFIYFFKKSSSKLPVLITLCSGALLHLVCDTITGIVFWFYPLSKKGYNLFDVSDTHIWWVHNYMYHWTFLIEIAIIVTAMAIFLRVRETAVYIAGLFRNDRKLRLIAMPIIVCLIGVFFIILVGSLRFNIDNKIFHKLLKLKHRVVKVAISQ